MWSVKVNYLHLECNFLAGLVNHLQCPCYLEMSSQRAGFVPGAVRLGVSGPRAGPQATPAGRNCTLIRGPTGFAVFGTACSQVRWHEPPITTRSP